MQRFLLISAALLLASLAAPARAQDAPSTSEAKAEKLHDAWQRLDRELQGVARHLDRVANDDSETRATELRALERRLLELADRADRLADPWRERLDARIRGLRQQALTVEAIDPDDGSRRPLSRTPRPADRTLPRTVVQPSDDCASAPLVPFGTLEGTFQPATNDGMSSCYGYPAPDRWYRIDASSADWVTIRDLSNSGMLDISVHESCPGTPQNTVACETYEPTSWKVEAPQYWIRLADPFEDGPDINLELAPSSGITGTVTDLAGAPLSEVYVKAGNAFDNADGSTDQDGKFELFGLPAGDYRVWTALSGYSNSPTNYVNEAWPDVPCPGGCGPDHGDPIPVPEGETVAGIDFALGRGATLSGTVVKASNGTPATGFVNIYNANGDLIGNPDFEADGSWIMYTVPPGRSYVLMVSNNTLQLWDGIPCSSDFDCDPKDGTPIPTSHGETIEGIDFVVDDSTTCVEDPLTVCIDSQTDYARFRVTTHVQSNEGQGVDLWAGHLESYSLPYNFRGGILYFFDESNPEMLVKVLDACALNGHFWVFSAAATSLGYDLIIEDMVTGQKRIYNNPDRTPAATITDTEAFSCS